MGVKHHRGVSTTLPGRSRRSGFTLLEVLAAMSVFVILLTLVMQIFGPASDLISASQDRIEATRAAQGILDAMANDFTAMVGERGGRLTVGPGPVAPSGSFSFVTDARPPSEPGDPSDNRFVQVFYGVVPREVNDLGLQTTPTIPVLCRGIERMLWTDGNARFTAGPGQIFTLGVAGGSAMEVWEPLWEGALRMEVVFILSDGSLSPNPAVGGAPAFPPAMTTIDPSTLRGVVIGLAVLDKRSLKILIETRGTSGVEVLAAALPPVAAVNTTPLQAWAAASLPNDLPAPVRAGLRFFERTFFFPEGGTP